MAGLMIINGSPRAPRSNSKRLIALFAGFWGSGQFRLVYHA